MCFVQLFINYGKFYRNQYSLPAVSRLARRGEQWLHVCNIQLFRERLSEKVHATIPKGIVGSFEFTFLGTRGHGCLFARAKGKQQKQVRQLQCQEHCIDHIPYYLSGLSRALISDNLSRNSCIYKQITRKTRGKEEKMLNK